MHTEVFGGATSTTIDCTIGASDGPLL